MAQSVGTDYVGPLTFSCVRSLIGEVVLLLCVQYSDRKRAKMQQTISIPGARKTLVTGGVCYGMLLCLANSFQQFGIQYTTVGKTGFITACYIIIVPILGLFFRKKCNPMIVGVVVLSMAGSYLLYMTGSDLSVSKSDLLMPVYAALFAMHIMIIDFFSPVVDGIKMSYIQFFVCGILLGMGMLLYEASDMGRILATWASVLYAGVMPCGVAYTLQITGQKGTDSMVASPILSLESSISVLAEWVILSRKFTAKELISCVLMFTAIILA